MLTLILTSLLSVQLLVPSNTYAQKIDNGGDGLEALFTQYRIDLSSWIQQGGLQYLDLPEGMDHGALKEKLLNAFETTQVEFTAESLRINGKEKTCTNTPSLHRIRCNTQKFQSIGAALRYVLVFHEYLGVVGVEANQNGESVYPISNQIQKFIIATKTYRLQVPSLGASHKKICIAGFTKEIIKHESIFASNRISQNPQSNFEVPSEQELRILRSKGYQVLLNPPQTNGHWLYEGMDFMIRIERNKLEGTKAVIVNSIRFFEAFPHNVAFEAIFAKISKSLVRSLTGLLDDLPTCDQMRELENAKIMEYLQKQ